MAVFLSSSGPCFPEERLLTHLLRSAATATPETFKNLHGNHPVDIYQSQNAYEIRTDAPGVSQDDVVVEVHEDMLLIAVGANKPSSTTAAASAAGAAAPDGPSTSSANGAAAARPPSPPAPDSPPAAKSPTASSSSSSSWKLLRRERSHPSAWSRAFLLPETADAEHISVRLDKGLLTVHVPKCPPPPKPQPRRIAVHSQ